MIWYTDQNAQGADSGCLHCRSKSKLESFQELSKVTGGSSEPTSSKQRILRKEQVKNETLENSHI